MDAGSKAERELSRHTPAYLSAQLAHVKQRRDWTPALFVAACRGNYAKFDQAKADTAAADRAARDEAFALELGAALAGELIDPDDLNILRAAFPGGYAQVIAEGVITRANAAQHSPSFLRSKLLRAARERTASPSIVEPKPRRTAAAVV